MTPLSLYPHAPEDAIARLARMPEAMPRRADVVVVGGGIVGAASAYYLAQRGLTAILVEKDKVASHQSGRNWGFVRTQYRDPAELPLAVTALSIWPGLAAALESDIGWRRSGCLFVSGSDAEHALFARWHDAAKPVATDARLVSAGEVARLVPAYRGPGVGGLYTASDGQAEPTLATLGFAHAAARRGARILEDCGAVAIEVAGGRIAGVLTEHGAIRAPVVVCAAGAASHLFLDRLGLALPQQAVRSTVSQTAPMPRVSEPCFCGLGLGVRQRPDGSCIVAADAATDIDLTLDSLRSARFFLRELVRHRRAFSLTLGRPFLDDVQRRLLMPRERRAIEPRRPHVAPNMKRVAGTAALFGRLFGAGAVPVVKSWAGLIDATPDALPVIDAPAAVPGLVVATGFSGHGFGLGPAVGHAVAELVAGVPPGVALDPFRLDRFRNGTYARAHAPL